MRSQEEIDHENSDILKDFVITVINSAKESNDGNFINTMIYDLAGIELYNKIIDRMREGTPE